MTVETVRLESSSEHREDEWHIFDREAGWKVSVSHPKPRMYAVSRERIHTSGDEDKQVPKPIWGTCESENKASYEAAMARAAEFIGEFVLEAEAEASEASPQA